MLMATAHDPVTQTKTKDAGVLFACFLVAGTASEVTLYRERLIETHVMPLIRMIVARKLRVDPLRLTGRQGPDEERAQDMYVQSAVALCRQLDRWRAEPAQAPHPEKFLDYVAVVAFNACKGVHRGTDPQAQVTYLLTHVTGFALWHTPNHVPVGGYREWQEAGLRETSASVRDDLLRDPEGFALAGLQARQPNKSLRQCRPPEILAALLDRAGAPLDLAALAGAFAALGLGQDKRIQEVSLSSLGQEEENDADRMDLLVDTGVSKGRPNQTTSLHEAEQVEADHLRLLLQRLWTQILTLPLHQRKALLLNFPGLDIRRLPGLKIARFDEIAAALEKTPDEMAALWNRLPLEDTEIALELDLTEPKVKNLRYSAYRTVAWRLRPFGRGALRKLWMAASQLIPLRPAVFLLRARDPLGASLLALLPREEIAGRTEIAEKIQITLEALNRVWDELPLSFGRISALLERVPHAIVLLYDEACAQLKPHLAELTVEE
jgi:hypothetical protein